MPKADGILFCGGGTGGHVLPGLAVAAALRGQGERTLRWIGDPARIEARLVPAAGIPLLPWGLSRPRPANPWWLVRALGQAWRCFGELRRRPPRVVVALGGYAALLPGLMAPVLRRPLVVMEQNARPGRTNRLLARFAHAVVTQFPEARRELPAARVSQFGNPVRPIRHLPRGQAPGLRVLVAGGSLAAKSLNDLVALAAVELRDIPGLSIVHLAGEEDRARIAAIYASVGLRAEVHGFLEDMPALYDRIDLAVTRAGATTVAELCAAGIPALYVPLPWAADDHQTANAKAVARVGGAVVVPQATATPTLVANWIARLARDRALVERMGHAANRLARPDAAERVAALVQGADPTVVRRGHASRRTEARQRWARWIKTCDVRRATCDVEGTPSSNPLASPLVPRPASLAPAEINPKNGERR
jgi:UDP-N-acetylglucosamine--N-acetylmuramyl-(pentapeptide) pyrophosphoryl-undecaprenol N-acetylglucosamine transferase